MSAKYMEKWLLVEYRNKNRKIIQSQHVMDKENDNLRVGSPLIISKRGERQLVTLLARSNERPLLQKILEAKNAGSCRAPETVYDYSSSSSLTSNDDDLEFEVVPSKSRPVKKYIDKLAEKNQGVGLSDYKHNTIQPASRKITNKGLDKIVTTRRRRHNIMKTNEYADNNFKKVVQYRVEPNLLHLKIDLNMVTDEKALKNKIIKIVSSIKHNRDKQNLRNNNRIDTEEPVPFVQIPTIEAKKEVSDDECEKFNRLNDNVLLPQKIVGMKNKSSEHQPKQNADDWVPIGSGKTRISKDSFSKIKWKSYTTATRMLLLAVFSRRTLATHSLTGKRSPAFQDKPAKMCLDPKKISDIISEVMDRFDVTESRVRSIITTKCADEAKMYRTSLKKSNSMLPGIEGSSVMVTNDDEIAD